MDGELPDIADADRSEVEEHLRNMAASNRILGGTSAIMRHLTRLILLRPSAQPVRILDLGAGGADIPIALAEWARKRRIVIRVTAVDNDPTVIAVARRDIRPYPEICVDPQDIRTLPYQDRSFEFVMASQVIHHLETHEAVRVLYRSCRLATRGIVVSELRRRTLCLGVGWLGGRLIANRLSRDDVATSFANAFTPRELGLLAAEAQLPCWTVHKHGPCRLVLVTDMGSVACARTISPPCQAPAAI